MAKVMTFRVRCSSCIIYKKYWNIDTDEKCVCIPRIIQKDKRTNWSRTHYDFGHYGGHGLENHKNWKARYCRL